MKLTDKHQKEEASDYLNYYIPPLVNFSSLKVVIGGCKIPIFPRHLYTIGDIY